VGHPRAHVSGGDARQRGEALRFRVVLGEEGDEVDDIRTVGGDRVVGGIAQRLGVFEPVGERGAGGG
jgi:hypothetical protein